MNFEQEQRIIALSNANYRDIGSFIRSLTDLIETRVSKRGDKLAQKASGMKTTLLHVEFVLNKLDREAIFKNQTYYISLHADQIIQRNDKFFYSNPQIFGELPKEDVEIFKNVYMSDGLTTTDRASIWDRLASFLVNSAHYQATKYQQLVDQFSSQMDTFFVVLEQICPESPVIDTIINAYNSEVKKTGACVFMFCLRNQLVDHQDLIVSRDPAFLKNPGGFLVRGDVPADWMHLLANMSDENADLFWGYLAAITLLVDQFLPTK